MWNQHISYTRRESSETGNHVVSIVRNTYKRMQQVSSSDRVSAEISQSYTAPTGPTNDAFDAFFYVKTRFLFFFSNSYYQSFPTTTNPDFFSIFSKYRFARHRVSIHRKVKQLNSTRPCWQNDLPKTETTYPYSAHNPTGDLPVGYNIALTFDRQPGIVIVRGKQ